MSDRYSKEYLDIIENDLEKNTVSAKKQVDDILHSTARYHGIYVRTCYMPKIFSENEYASFGELIKTIYAIFDKVIKHYYDDADYRSLFGFDEKLEKLSMDNREPRTTAETISKLFGKYMEEALNEISTQN